MITIISGTNRAENNTLKVAKAYKKILHSKGIASQVLDLAAEDFFTRNESFLALEKKYLLAATHFIIVSPEYNGSFPGVLKLLIDNSNVSESWWGKKALLTGVSSGRAGNLRGMEHLTGILLHLRMYVHHDRLPLSGIDGLLSVKAILHDEDALAAMQKQVEEFL